MYIRDHQLMFIHSPQFIDSLIACSELTELSCVYACPVTLSCRSSWFLLGYRHCLFTCASLDICSLSSFQ